MHSLSLVGLLALAAAPPAPVSAVAYHPDGNLLAAGRRGEVVLVDPDAATATRTLGVLAGRATAAAYDPPGRWLAVADGVPGKSGSVHLYPTAPKGTAAATSIAHFDGHRDAVYGLAFNHDGSVLATAGYDRVIRLWAVPVPGTLLPNASVGFTEPLRELKDHSDTVYSLAFSPDGSLLASAAADRAVKVWDAKTGDRLYTLGDPTDWVYAVAWSPDGKRLAAGGVDKSVRVWEVDRAGGRLVRSAFAHDAAVLRLAFSPDGKTLYSLGEDRVVKAWDAAKLVETKVFPARPDAVLSFALRPDGKQLALGRFDGVLELVDPITAKVTPVSLNAEPAKAKDETPAAPAAKPKPPQGTGVTPGFAPRGSATKVAFAGKELAGVTSVTTSVPGVAVTVLKATAGLVEAEITVSANAPAGPVQLTLTGDDGRSAPVTFVVDRFAAVAEKGVTDSARAAQVVTLPVTVGGSVDRAGDVDFFWFEAAAGQEVGAQVLAAELGSKLDPVLVLTDAGGRVLAEGGSLLGHRVEAAGTYAVVVRDREYRGGPNMGYRLSLGNIPVVTGVFPLGVQRGRTADVHLRGVNLPSAARTVKLTVPPTAAVGSRVPVPLPTTAGEPPLGMASVVVDEFPGVVVAPAAGAELRAVPGSADGILLTAGASQAVKFPAKAGERLVVEVNARRLGSPVDPVIDILDAHGKSVPLAALRCTARTFVTFRDHDSEKPGIRLEAWNDFGIDDHVFINGELTRILALPKGPDDDCQFYQEGGKRSAFWGTTPSHHANGTPVYKVERHPPGTAFPPNGMPVFTLHHRNDDGGPGYGKDSRLFFDPPANGTYQVRVTDARGEGGPGHAYRVTVRPPKPGFDVTMSPNAPAVWRGGAVPVTMTATRRDGFDGRIEVKLEGLPPGFSAPPTFIDAGQPSTSFALFAAADAKAPPKDAPIPRLVARAIVAERTVGRKPDADGLLTSETVEIEGQSVEQPVGVPRLVEPGDLVTTTREAAVRIRPGQETKLTVNVERRNGFAGRVPVEVRGLPHGVRVLNIGLNGILLTPRDSSREITLYAEPWVEPLTHPVVVLARREGTNAEHAARSVLLTVEK